MSLAEALVLNDQVIDHAGLPGDRLGGQSVLLDEAGELGSQLGDLVPQRFGLGLVVLVATLALVAYALVTVGTDTRGVAFAETLVRSSLPDASSGSVG